MKINFLAINDFRGFRDLSVEFSKASNIIVFIGINGSGKSTILDAISILLNVIVKDISSQKKTSIVSYKELNQNDTNLNANNYSIRMAFSKYNIVENIASQNYFISLLYYVDIIGTYNDFVKEIKSSISELEIFNLPIFIHYSINRNIADNIKKGKSKHIPNYQYPQYFAYENVFSNAINSFDEFIQWFRQEEDLENQIQRTRQDFKYRNERLEVIRFAIDKFLNKFGFARFSNLRIEREPNHVNRVPITLQYITRLVIDKDQQRFEFSQLSSGEKMMLSLVVDIARRLAIANPSLDNKLEGEGIVLIDEIDLHLHPQWQRKLLPALTHTFPNIQFIVTTHSPQVLSHLSRESVFLLEDNKISDREIYTEGRDSNSILQDAFHLPKYEKEYENKLREIYQLIDNDDGKNAQELLEKLKEKRGENDLEVMRMQSYIDLI
jgi:predicted ATP-binding protein involved in virulence